MFPVRETLQFQDTPDAVALTLCNARFGAAFDPLNAFCSLHTAKCRSLPGIHLPPLDLMEDVPSPEWHGTVLAVRITTGREGRSTFIECEESK